LGIPYLLETKGLSRNFDGFAALRGVDFTLAKGEIRIIIGPNGAGKTTFFKLIFGEIAPSSGKVVFKGKDIGGLSPWQICRLGVGRSYQITNIFPQLSIRENIRMAVQAKHVVYNFWSSANSFNSFHEKAIHIIGEIGLESQMEQVASNLSHGEQRKLEMGLALASEPELLLLDEPTAGMSMEETKQTAKFIQEIARERALTILMVEHKMDVVYAIADRITVFHQGSVLATGSPDDIRNNEQVKSVYFRGKKDHA
jgi:branched-chain amino acid transport system ATP-binding protein